MRPMLQGPHLAGLAMILVGLFAVPVSADLITLTAIDAGFVTEAGGSAKGDGTLASPATYNYSVGREVHFDDGSLTGALAPMDRKNYFAFDLSGVTGTITSATLSLYAGPDTPPPFPDGEHGYESLDPTETYEIFETTDPTGAAMMIGDLAAGTTPGEFDEPTDPLVMTAADLYSTLADGPLVLGGAILSPAEDGTTVGIPITPGGLDYLNLFVGDTLVLGGSLTTAVPPDTPQLVFGFTGPDIPGGDPMTPTLELTTAAIPEPGSIALMLTALVPGLLITRRRE